MTAPGPTPDGSQADLDRLVRWLVYHHFREAAAPPPLNRLARLADATPEDTHASLQRLHAKRALVLFGDGPSIRMALPFASYDSGTHLRVGPTHYDVNCPWDALGLAGLLGVDADLHTTDPETGDAIALEVMDGALRSSLNVLHFVVPAARFWDDIGFT